MRRSVLPCLLGSLTFAAAFAFGTPDAHAARYYVAAGAPARGGDQGLAIGLDADLLIPVANTIGGKEPFATGVGIEGRIGYRIGRGFFVQPEGQFGFLTLAGAKNTVVGVSVKNPSDTMGRFMGGVRLGPRLGLFEPQLITHVGYAAASSNFGGFAYDVGAAGDFHFRHVSFGPHLTWNQVLASTAGGTVGTAGAGQNLTTTTASVHFLSLGVHGTIIF